MKSGTPNESLKSLEIHYETPSQPSVSKSHNPLGYETETAPHVRERSVYRLHLVTDQKQALTCENADLRKNNKVTFSEETAQPCQCDLCRRPDQ